MWPFSLFRAAPLCIHCRWCEPALRDYHKCFHPRVGKQSLVNGNVEPGYCVNARESYGRCKPAGRLFEMKPPLAQSPLIL